MSDLGSSFDPQIGRPESGARITSWRRFATSAFRSPKWKKWVLLALPMLLVIPVLAAVAWFAAKPNPLLKAPGKDKTTGLSSFLLSSSSRPKPAPGKTREQVAPPVPSSYTPLPPVAVQPSQPSGQVALPEQSVSGVVAPAPIAPTIPNVPVTTARPPATPLVYRAKHDKVFGGSCSGQLTLNSGGLVFNCPDDPHGSIQIALNEIGAVDENGVRLLSGKKYHFSISGMNKSGEEALFANWLHQVR